MDKLSWVMLAGIVLTMLFFLIQGMGYSGSPAGYLMAIAFALLVTVVLVALMCVPVLIYCYFVKMIPDIDYSVRAAFAFTLVGIISEFIF